MNLEETIKALYESEINCGLQSFWDGGFEVWLGDEHNGIMACQNFAASELDRAGDWLGDKAREIYPDSLYASRRRAP